MSSQKEKIVARDRDHLRQIVFESIEKYGPICDLNFIDVSQVTDMYCIFSGPNSVFNGDISGWDVSNVESMNDMFHGSQFNGDISGWNVSKVQDMSYMFQNSAFNGDIGNWNVSNVGNMSCMFRDSQFNRDISRWDVSSVFDMSNMFAHSQFNGDISQWNVSNVKMMIEMFSFSQFTGDISGWNFSKDVCVFDMFYGSLMDMKGLTPEWCENLEEEWSKNHPRFTMRSWTTICRFRGKW